MMADTLINLHSIGSREISYLRFADDIDLISSYDELQQLTISLSKHASGYGMEIFSEKRKTMIVDAW